MLDRKHMRRRRMMIDIEPDPSRQRTSGQYVEVTNADILNNVPFDIPISSGDEYDGGEDEAELLPDFDEQEQSILALDESSGSEEADFLPSTETLGRTAPSKRTRETNNLRTVDAVNEILSASTSNATTTDDNESCDSRPRRKKIKRSIIETLMSDEGSHSSLEEDLLLTSKAEDISLPQAALLAIVRTTVSPWLQVTGPKSRPFLPQLKDLVIYCRKGHEEFASMVTDYPMIVDNTLPDILLARVISMKYFISGTEVICSIKLGIFPTMEPTEIPDSKLSSLVIEILYRPELEDFLALWVDYEFSSSNYFSVGDSCAAFVLGKEVFGNLINIKRGPSLWKKYSIQDVDGHVFEVSPWAIRNVNDDFAPYPSIPSTEKDRILPILQEFMETEHLATFADEIPYEEVPTYLDLVAYPVWAKLIHSRIVSGYYRSVAQVGFEWDLLCKNVNTFNKRGSLICQLCKSDVAPFKQRLIGSNSMGTLLTVPKVEFKPDEFEDFDEDEENEDDFSAFSEETDADEGTNIERVGKLKKSRRKSKRSRKSEKDLDEHYEFMSDGGDEDILDFPSSPPRSTRSTRHTSPSRQSRKNSPSRQPRSARHVSRSQEVLQQSTSEAGRLKEQKKRIGKGSKTNAYTNADDMGPSSRLPARIQAQTKRKFSEVDLKRIIGDSSDDSYAADLTDKRINRPSSKIQPKRKRKPKGFGESESEDMQDSSSSYRS